MQRRDFSKAVTASTALALASWPEALETGSNPGRGDARANPAIGTNLSGMEWARPGLRYGLSSLPNIHFSVPRKADVAYLAACGFTRNRLPIQWELLQPMLHDTGCNPQVRAAIGEPGAFHEGYASSITGVLDAHAAAGIRCIVDLHNYCRYQDFVFQPDGSVRGFASAPAPLLRPYTRDRSQVQVRIFSLARQPSLTRANFADFWRRAAERWAQHPGFGGYGLMNEPHDMPRRGRREASTSAEDLMVWPAYARDAIDAIRAIDPNGPIYLAGNAWSSAMSIGSHNPAWPLEGENLIYEVHVYLDASSSGTAFDYATEVGKSYSAGFGKRPIHRDTGLERIRIATEWARSRGVKLALTEIGMPIDDPRWEEMFQRVVDHAWRSGCEIYSWMGGCHWPVRNHAINHVPGWHQNRTLEPAVSGRMKAAAGISGATLYDDMSMQGGQGEPVTITVYARGNLDRPVELTVRSDNGGTLSTRHVTLPAGPNGRDSFTFACAPNRPATLSYRRTDGGQVPPSRKVHPSAAPASAGLPDAAMAIIALYRACKWDLADGYTDYVLGKPASVGQDIRAIADSGCGSSMGNAMEMLNWMNNDSPAMGPVLLPVMRVAHGRKCSDHTVAGTSGFWCKKSAAVPGIQPRPSNRVPYHLGDPHFVIAVASVPGPNNTGVLFQASKAEGRHASELAFSNSHPQARWIDSTGKLTELHCPHPVAPHEPAVVSFTCAQGNQQLRVNSVPVAMSNVNFAGSEFTQMLIGWGFLDHFPRPGFGGHVYSVIAGKGAPTLAELFILEKYLAGKASRF